MAPFWGAMLVFGGIKGNLETIELRWPDMTQGTPILQGWVLIHFCSEHCTLFELLLCQIRVVCIEIDSTIIPSYSTISTCPMLPHLFYPFLGMCNWFISMCLTATVPGLIRSTENHALLICHSLTQKLSWLESVGSLKRNLSDVFALAQRWNTKKCLQHHTTTLGPAQAPWELDFVGKWLEIDWYLFVWTQLPPQNLCLLPAPLFC